MYLCHVAVCGCYLGKLANYSKCTVTFIIVAARSTAVVTGLSAFQLTTVVLMSMQLSCLVFFFHSTPGYGKAISFSLSPQLYSLLFKP